MENHIVDHFYNMFNNQAVLQDNDLIQEVVLKLFINDQSNALLTMIPTTEEIKKAVFRGDN